MSKDWLWDRKTTDEQARKILKDPAHRNFILFSSLLLARKNEPHEVFKKYIDPVVFCENWADIKRNMRKDNWASQRIIFWQAVYESLKAKYKRQGVRFREKKKAAASELLRQAGGRIRELRKEQGLSQKDFAGKLGVSQQLVSRIEKGDENISLLTIANIAKALGKKVRVEIK